MPNKPDKISENAAELDNAALEEVAGGLSLGTAPVRDDIIFEKQTDKNMGISKLRSTEGKIPRVGDKTIEKSEIAKVLRDAADKANKIVIE